MKITTPNIEGLPELLELPEEFKDFLLQPETQKQLNTYDIKGIYDKLNLSKVKYIGLFTQLLYSIDINPLDYFEYIPDFFLDSASLVTIKIPNNIKSINNYAFYNCSELASITIPDSVTSIGEFAFYNCNKLQNIYITDIVAWCNISGLNYLMDYGASNKKLYINNELATSITIPNGVTAIPSYVFCGCSGLKSVTIPDSVTSIGDWAFRDCAGLTSITIPDSVISIGWGAFRNCSGLTSVTIPSSVGSIGEYAFYNCSKLRNIKYTGTKDQWLKINHEYRWNGVSPIKTIHCIDGDIKL